MGVKTRDAYFTLFVDIHPGKVCPFYSILLTNWEKLPIFGHFYPGRVFYFAVKYSPLPPAPVTPFHGGQNPVKILPIPFTLVQLLAGPKACEEHMEPEHILVGNIMSSLASLNTRSRVAPLTANLAPEALSWKRLNLRAYYAKHRGL